MNDEYIMSSAKKNPYKETALHAEIEHNLTKAYKQYISSLDA